MSDPFDVLRSELVKAAGRREPVRRWRGLGARRRPLAVVLAALVICGSATAAVLSLSSSPSQPLAGRVPGTQAGPGTLAGSHYRIVVTPSLGAGQPGWSTGVAYARPRYGLVSGESAGGAYPTASNPVFGGVGDAFAWSGEQRSDTVAIVLAGPQVAAIRVAGRTIRTFASPQLPTRDRAAVFFVPPGGPQPTLGWRAGDPIHARMRVPIGSNQWKEVPTVALLPLDRAGRLLPSTFMYPDPPFASFWQAPAAVTPNIHGPAYHGPTRPSPSGICQLGSRGLPGLKPAWGHTIARFARATGSVGELFESCVDAEYYLRGWPLAVGLLLDARRPGRVLGPLPGASPVPGHPQTVDFAAASLSARRIGNAWLVVRGGSGRAQRLRVLDALRISKLAVRG